MTTRAQDRHIRTSHLRNRFLTATATTAMTRGQNNNRICAQTVRRRLAEHGIRARRPYNGPKFTRRHRRNRAVGMSVHSLEPTTVEHGVV